MVVALIYGGVSVEHVVSCRSAVSVSQELTASGYKVMPIAISREGHWSLKENASLDSSYDDSKKVAVVPAAGLTLNGEPLEVDVVFPVTHGTKGEDGCLQGLLELAGLPYVGSGVLASSVGMHKSITKRVCEEFGIPTLPSVLIKRGQPYAPRAIADLLGQALIVKPEDGGSSVGVIPLEKATGGHLREAVEEVFNYTNRILIEPYLLAVKEVECAVITNKGKYLSSPAGLVVNPVNNSGFLNYQQKYLSSNQAYIEVPAPIGKTLSLKITEMAQTIASAVAVEGYARVDFFIDKDGKIWFNEINTLPGLTSKSHFPLLAEVMGYPYPRLLSHLIEEARTPRRPLQLYGEE